MKKLKVVTVVGTRPEVIRLSRVIDKLNKNCQHILIHTGQNNDYELNEIFIDELKIAKPHYLNFKSTSGINFVGNMLIQVDRVLEKEKPDAFLVLGDTNSALSIIAAKRRKIPTFHMEAGNRCFDMRVPEEINRRIIDHSADLNLPYSKIARDYLIDEGLNKDLIIKTGSPMNEVLNFYKKNIEASTILDRLKLKNNKFFLISSHREENIESEKNFNCLCSTLNVISEKYKLPIIFSTHPRTKKRIDDSNFSFNKLITFLKPLGFFDYNKLQMNAHTVLSDSGTINEESSILKFRALNIRDAHERPEAMEEAAVMMVGLNSERVIQGIQLLQSQRNYNSSITHIANDYQADNVSEKILRIIISYTDYINRVMWKNY